MPTLARTLASNTAGTLLLQAIELAHPAWSAPVRRVMNSADLAVTLAGEAVTFANAIDAGGWTAAISSIDDTGRAERSITLADADGSIETSIEAVRGDTTPISVTLYLYLSTDLSAPQWTQRLSVQSASPGSGSVQLGCVTRDIANELDPWLRHTADNTPGLRGR